MIAVFAALPPLVATLLWPAILALVFALGAIVSFAVRARRFMWPFLAGFVTVLVTVALLLAKLIRSPWTSVIWGAVVFAVAMAAVVGLWLVVTLRARALEKRLLKGVDSGPSADQQQIERLRKDMAEALDLLRKAGSGRNAIYTLPWYLVLGRPQAGKTVAIKNSGLTLPVRKDWVKGVGGTHTCDWFFTNEVIFLDTPGRWVVERTARGEQQQWLELLRLLRKFRRDRPLDGIVVVVPADDLLGPASAEVVEHASRIRELVDTAHQELGIRFPVYLVVSKCDLVEGFVDFFRGLPGQRKHEILGFSNSLAPGQEPRELLQRGAAEVQRRLEECRLESLARVGSRTQARRLYFFPEEFRRLEQALAGVVDALFRGDAYREAPLFRGVYFTSGTQGTGTPLGHAMQELARGLGVSRAPAPVAAAGEEDPKRSYFLLDLFKTLLPGDVGLVGSTSGSGSRRRRVAALVAAIPALAGLVLLGFSTLSFVLNRSLFTDAAQGIPAATAALDRMPAGFSGDQLAARLEQTGRLRDYHEKLSGFSFWRGFGMRRAGALAFHAGRVFEQRFLAQALKPALAQAETFASTDSDCNARLETLHAAVRLRLASGWNWSDDEPGFDKAWKLPAEQARAVQKELRDQYEYLVEDLEVQGVPSLPGFSILSVVQSIKEQCFSRTAASSLEAYQGFQAACQDKSAPSDLRACYSSLREALRAGQSGGKTILTSFEAAKEALAKLAEVDRDARTGLDTLAAVHLAQAQTGECLADFDKNIAPAIREYADQDDLLAQCQDAVKAAQNPLEKQKARDDALAQQAGALQKKEEELRTLMQQFTDRCAGGVPGFRRLEPGVLKRVTEGYRRGSCLELGSQVGGMASIFNDGIRGRFPFTPDANAKLVEAGPLTQFLGGQTGFVTQFRAATGGKGVSPAVQSWLDQARVLSETLFEEGTDTLKAARISVTFGAPELSPPDLGKNLKVTEVSWIFSEGQKISWKEGEPRTRSVEIELFGRGVSDFSAVYVTLAERKGMLGRATSKENWVDLPSVEVASAKGNWAPLRLVGSARSGRTVTFEAPVAGKKKKGEGTVKLTFEVEGEGLDRLLSLMKRGFPGPPAGASAD